MGTPFDGTHRPPEGSRPAPIGTYVFETATNTPGWGKPGSGSFDDPRDEPYLPMPADWVKWRGIYIHNDHVVFSYTVGSCAVLESPWYDSNAVAGSFTRTFKIAPNDQAMEMLAADEKGEVTTVADQTTVSVGKLLASIDGARRERNGTKRGPISSWQIPPHQADIRLKVVIAPAPVDAAAVAPHEADKSVVDVDHSPHGGTPRYSADDRNHRQARPGRRRLTWSTRSRCPDENPWHSLDARRRVRLFPRWKARRRLHLERRRLDRLRDRRQARSLTWKRYRHRAVSAAGAEDRQRPDLRARPRPDHASCTT